MSLDEMLDVVEASIVDRRRADVTAMLLRGVDPDDIDGFLDEHAASLQGWRAQARRDITRILARA